MKKYEHYCHIATVKPGIEFLEKELDRFGDEGWELVGIQQKEDMQPTRMSEFRNVYFCIFKREKHEISHA